MGHEEEHRRIKKILDAVDKLKRDLKDKVDIKEDIAKSLFSIIVVGGQSVGKSSLLEAISGVPLPKGPSKTVTRSPISIQLRGTEDGEDESIIFKFKKHGMSSETEIPCPALTADSVTDVYNRIVDELAPPDGSDKPTITDEVVVMRVTRRDLCSLTLIDLPGFVADGPRRARIEQLVREHINMDNNFILKVKKAFDDMQSVLPGDIFAGTEERLITVENFMGAAGGDGSYEAGTVQLFAKANAGKKIPVIHGVRLQAKDETGFNMEEVEERCYKNIAMKDGKSGESQDAFLKACGVKNLVKILVKIQERWLMGSEVLKDLRRSVQDLLDKDQEKEKTLQDLHAVDIRALGTWNYNLMLKYKELLAGEHASDWE